MNEKKLKKLKDKNNGKNKYRLPLIIALFATISIFINIVIFIGFFDFYDPGYNNGIGIYSNQYKTQDFYRIISGVTGKIPILMYHNILTPKLAESQFTNISSEYNRYFVTSDEFRDQLEALYKNNFRNISLDEYLSLMRDGKSELDRLPPGVNLYILTFDDAAWGQFTFLETNDGELIIDPDSAVGIMLDFADKYPEFKLNAAFNIDWENIPFMQPEYVEEKLNLLLDYGFEIVNHTATHRYLSKYIYIRPDIVEFEIGRAMELFESYLGYRVSSIDKISYPGGKELPAVWEFVKEINFNGRKYKFIAGLDAEGYQADNPNSPEFNPFDISRIEINSSTFERYVLNARGLFKTPFLYERERQSIIFDSLTLLSNGIIESIP